MKAISMIQGLMQMLDFLGEDSSVSIRVKTENGEVITVPLKRVTAGTNEEGVVLTNIDEEA